MICSTRFIIFFSLIWLPHAIFALAEVEKLEEKGMSFFGIRFNNVRQLKGYQSKKNNRIKLFEDQKMHPFYQIEVFNKIDS